jgi:hypothetical protein
MSNIQLHVGYIGITREGKRVEIIHDNYDPEYQWESEITSYTDKGCVLQSQECMADIIGPWVETPVEPLPNYNDGNWHRWDGATAECPVHESSTVEVNYIDGEGHTIIDDLRASSLNWGSTYEPILAFRVTEEYVAPVEPREFWIVPATGKCFMSKPAYTSAIHVREVI